VRPFAFIGPYQLIEKPWAINNFIRDSLMGGPIRILGNGDTVRSYMYGSEMAYWMLRILLSGKSGHNYNVGSPNPISLKDLATKVSNNFSPLPPILSRNGAETEATHSKFIPNIDVVKKEMSLDIKIDIDEALRKTIEWNKLLV
jgi:dTDP-glucose 4,6-dehydratase